MSSAVMVLRAGPVCTLQDKGRFGWLRFGVTPSGPMDWISHRTANILAGNDPATVAIEVGPGGMDVAADGGPIRIGVVARGFLLRRNGVDLPESMSLDLSPGDKLELRSGQTGLWAYLSVQGGFDLAPVMGSLSTHLRSAIGPLQGMALSAGQTLPVRGGGAAPQPDLILPPGPALTQSLRFIPGPQAEAFTAAGFATFCSEPYTVSTQSDRMGYRLAGPRIAHRKGHDIVSDGIAMGAIQVPGDCQPLILMADRQPTGGYPKIGNVILADLPSLAQARPGARFHFRPVDVDQAVAALGLATLSPAKIIAACRPMASGIDLEKLASGDHASGFVDARLAPQT